MKKKAASFVLLIFFSASLLLMPFSMVTGQLGVNIYLVNPEEEGVAGETVNLQGTIDTTDGRYQIWFDEILAITSYSEGYYVNANFTIPALPEGDHVITLRDVTTNLNATHDFSLKLAYYIEAEKPSSPAQLQEGDDIILNVTIAGVQPSTTHYANVTVKLPEPISASFSRIVALVSSSEETVATSLVTYPAALFEPAGSLTNYTGSYKIYYNETESLAENEFFVGFTDLRYYHRSEIVEIRAIGYQPSENATISITYSESETSVYSESVTASNEGVFESSWAVPFDALIGNYNITLTSDSTNKLVPDSQIFSVPGYTVKVQTFNLAGQTVSEISVEALDQATDEINSGSSDYQGIANLKLEVGNHLITGFWNGVNVGELNVSVTGPTSFDLTCELTNVEITVQNENGNLMPFVELDIMYQYLTTKENTLETGFTSGETDLSGNFILTSVLPGTSYTINASLYNVVFNAGNKSVTNLPVQPASKVMIICPSKTLTLSITDFNADAISNARIELVEVTNGLFNGGISDAAGTVTVEVTFGKYRLRVYKDEILLNSTSIEVFRDIHREISCSLFNIQVEVMVVDYFAQPIPNMNIVLHRSGLEPWSSTTQTNGEATFSDVVGGDMQIIVYPDGAESNYEAFNVHIQESKEVEIKLNKYILVGPFLVESSALATFIIIFIALLLFVSLEVYRRKEL